MPTHEDIRALEEISFRGWHALENERYDGWVLRAANGYTGRANSINPLYPSSHALDDKIAYCDAWYAARGIPPIFRLNDAMQPPDLDAQLAARGYRRFNESRVMTAELGDALTLNPSPTRRHAGDESAIKSWATGERDFDTASPPCSDSPSPTSAGSQPVTSSGSPSPRRTRRSGEGFRVRADLDTWIADLCRLNPRHAPHVATMRLLFDRMPPERLFASVRVGDEAAAVGLGVLHDGYLGLYDIVTDERLRGRGYGRMMVSGLLRAASEAGITRAYLQVAADNAPAIRLYEGLGFRVSYGYWYRGNQITPKSPAARMP
jgi:ribosomal protein S18 acetylase RimI-like enzyme